jgi:general secretion pathway protein G
MFKSLRNEKGFTMIEMMVVLIIIAVLIAGGIKFYLGYIENSKVTKAKGNISMMQAWMDAYFAEKYNYPVNRDEFLDAGIDIADEATGNPFKTKQNNPWGSAYVINLITPESPKGYQIYTEYDKIQEDKVVFGDGENGTSTTPQLLPRDELGESEE